jgi:NAD(P)-dependent dehydrogenase (short-subunit alcohol dehydrogenase family)
MRLALLVLVSVIGIAVELRRRLAVEYPPPPAGGAVLVSGGSTGIGFDICVALAAETSFVPFCGVRKEVDAKRLRAISHGRIRPLILDVTKQEQIDAAIAAVRESGLPLAGLVNCAGGTARGLVETTHVEAYRRLMDVNFFGVIALSQAALPLLREVRARRRASRGRWPRSSFFARLCSDRAGPLPPTPGPCVTRLRVLSLPRLVVPRSLSLPPPQAQGRLVTIGSFVGLVSLGLGLSAYGASKYARATTKRTRAHAYAHVVCLASRPARAHAAALSDCPLAVSVSRSLSRSRHRSLPRAPSRPRPDLRSSRCTTRCATSSSPRASPSRSSSPARCARRSWRRRAHKATFKAETTRGIRARASSTRPTAGISRRRSSRAAWR